jgi:hypothetical protein
MTSRIGEMKVLEGSDKAKAAELMKDIAVWVEPVMKKRNWFVPLLSERNFPQDGILGMNTNAGQRIELRLRRPRDRNIFFEVEMLIDTMLHELSHIVHQNHSAAFYELWEELRKELSSNVEKGLKGSGAGFDARGARVNEAKHNPSTLLEARQRAAEAADKRLKTSQLFGSGKLGGSNKLLGLGEAEAVRRATMQRCSEWCGCGDENKEKQVNETNRKKEDERKVDKKQEDEVVIKRNRLKEQTEVKKLNVEKREDVVDDLLMWSCEKCTFCNEQKDEFCAVCNEGENPGKKKKLRMSWFCNKCTFENVFSESVCVVCLQGTRQL